MDTLEKAYAEVVTEEEIQEAISLNALSGTEVPNTTRLQGDAQENKVTILLDSGSTHSFLDIETARKIGCEVSEASPMRVTVANESHLMSRHFCPVF